MAKIIFVIPFLYGKNIIIITISILKGEKYTIYIYIFFKEIQKKLHKKRITKRNVCFKGKMEFRRKKRGKKNLLKDCRK